MTTQETDDVWIGEDRLVTDNERGMRAVSLNTMIRILTTTVGGSRGTQVDTFLLTMPGFAQQHAVARRLGSRLHVPASVPAGDAKDIREAVCNVVNRWIELIPSDFGDETLKSNVRDSMQFATSFPECESLARSALMTIEMMSGSGVRGRRQEGAAPSATGDPASAATATTVDTTSSATPSCTSVLRRLRGIKVPEVARQMTVIDCELFSRITARHLIDTPSFQRRGGGDTNQSPVRTVIDRSNEVARWVPTEILDQETVNDRIKAVEFFAELADELLTLRNFNSAMAVMAGLNDSSIMRLKKTMCGLSKSARRSIQKVKDVTTSDMGFRALRRAMHGQETLPTIPFLGMPLTDITFILDGNPDPIQGMINWRRCQMLFTASTQALRFQRLPFPIRPNPSIIEALRALSPLLDEEGLYQRSLCVEPREDRQHDPK